MLVIRSRDTHRILAFDGSLQTIELEDTTVRLDETVKQFDYETEAEHFMDEIWEDYKQQYECYDFSEVDNEGY